MLCLYLNDAIKFQLSLFSNSMFSIDIFITVLKMFAIESSEANKTLRRLQFRPIVNQWQVFVCQVQ